jgi:hypothetical protein
MEFTYNEFGWQVDFKEELKKGNFARAESILENITYYVNPKDKLKNLVSVGEAYKELVNIYKKGDEEDNKQLELLAKNEIETASVLEKNLKELEEYRQFDLTPEQMAAVIKSDGGLEKKCEAQELIISKQKEEIEGLSNDLKNYKKALSLLN